MSGFTTGYIWSRTSVVKVMLCIIRLYTAVSYHNHQKNSFLKFSRLTCVMKVKTDLHYFCIHVNSVPRYALKSASEPGMLKIGVVSRF